MFHVKEYAAKMVKGKKKSIAEFKHIIAKRQQMKWL